MKTVVFLLLIIGIAAVIVFDIFRIKKKALAALFCKTAASTLFVLVGVFSIAAIKNEYTGGENFFIFVLAGLVFGLVGDMMLAIKSVIAEHKNTFIAAGIASFGIGHIFYIVAIMSNFELGAASVIIPILAAGVLASAIIFSAPLFNIDYKKLKPYCFVYSFLLVWSMCQSFAAAIVTNFLPLFSVVFIASGLFVVSDLILSHIYFSKQSSEKLAVSPMVVAFNHATYYGAQFLIALSILLI